MWLLLIPGGLIALFLYNKAKTAATATSNAEQGLSTNALDDFWSDANAYGAVATNTLSTAKSNSNNLITDAEGIFGAAPGSGAKGPASPSTSGQGAGGPTQQQIDDASADAGSDSDGGDDGSDDYGD